MKKAQLLSLGIGALIFTVALVFTVVYILCAPAPTEAQLSYGPVGQCYVVKIISQSDVQLISPVVNMYDCVVWLNWSSEETPKIVFTEGKACKLAIKAKTGFEADDPSGCFATKSLNYGETASLVFSSPGFFKYVIEFKDGHKMNGQVEVK